MEDIPSKLKAARRVPTVVLTVTNTSDCTEGPAPKQAREVIVDQKVDPADAFNVPFFTNHKSEALSTDSHSPQAYDGSEAVTVSAIKLKLSPDTIRDAPPVMGTLLCAAETT